MAPTHNCWIRGTGKIDSGAAAGGRSMLRVSSSHGRAHAVALALVVVVVVVDESSGDRRRAR